MEQLTAPLQEKGKALCEKRFKAVNYPFHEISQSSIMSHPLQTSHRQNCLLKNSR